MSPETVIALGRLGGLGVLDLEGLWTRYENPQSVLDEIAGLADETNSPAVTRRMQELYQAPIQPELITSRLAEIRAAGVTVAGSLTPQRTQEHYKTVVAAGVDIFVIRGTTVSAEHVSKDHEPLNLKQFIYELDVPVIVGGAAGYTAGPAPDAHRRRRRAGRLRRRSHHHHPPRPGHPLADGLRHLRRRGGPPRLHGRVRRTLRPCDRRRRHGHLRRHRQGDRHGRRRRDAGQRPGPRRRSPRQGLALGPGSPPPRTAPRRQGQRRHGRRRSKRSCSGPATTPTAPPTSSARCAVRWRPPATRT